MASYHGVIGRCSLPRAPKTQHLGLPLSSFYAYCSASVLAEQLNHGSARWHGLRMGFAAYPS